MARRGDPPEGTPEGLPGGEDEYRSVVFDESFVRAARVQEFSAEERLGEHAPAVRSLPAGGTRRASKQILLFVLLVAVAFGTAVYLGIRQPHQPAAVRPAEQLRITLVPLAPRGPVPGGTPAELFADGPAAQYRSGAAGITMPAVRRTAHFSEGQVLTALATAKDFLVESSLDPDVLTGGAVRPVRALLHPDQLAQFDRSVASPAADGRHATTGWLVRFDPAKVALADDTVRVEGTLIVTETASEALEITSDHTFVYALRPAATTGPASDEASLFTVRREMRFRFDRDDLRHHRLEALAGSVHAGPQDCGSDATGFLRPLLAGQRAGTDGPAVTDPYAPGPATASLCGTLSSAAQPSP
ncbi:hypothetical protein J7E88_24080 [Streptomyces sp. ISL-10]|uniref:SCO2583 family membrane protein n=1 Tax=Streptomyces sp. ISL-10 TaxID=2819172 RepID=UPI001BE7326B|nr:hypothetical protein [Streptomyces sp. ISL-10]MBT2368318.1 hypothetical protein [Streptomyces sp. ISL-10]